MGWIWSLDCPAPLFFWHSEVYGKPCPFVLHVFLCRGPAPWNSCGSRLLFRCDSCQGSAPPQTRVVWGSCFKCGMEFVLVLVCQVGWSFSALARFGLRDGLDLESGLPCPFVWHKVLCWSFSALAVLASMGWAGFGIWIALPLRLHKVLLKCRGLTPWNSCGSRLLL
jgi:hypothetical protein